MADAAILFAVEKLGDALIHKVSFLRGVEEQVRWVKDELESMRCFLKDAAEKQDQNESIRKWIRDVREMAQDAEDVIEIFTLKLDKPTRKRDLVIKWAGFPLHVNYLNRVGKEIKSIRSRLDEIAKRRDRYGIRNVGEVGMESSSSSRSRSEIIELRRRLAARFQKDKDVVGLNEDVDLLLSKLTLDGDGEVEGLSVVAIVGMGGIGKSTLARKIYNHPAVAARFAKRAWVVVSSEFAAEDTMKLIMHELSVSLDADELKTLESIEDRLRRQEMLLQMLRKRLEGKRYFIVLDDMWEEAHWQVLKNAFPNEQGKASFLLFTSRKEIFTKRQGYIHKMRVLKPEESWELLLKTALNGGRCPRELEDIGRQILEKCHGLPLAITVAGGLLESQEESKSGWERVLRQLKNYGSETNEIGKNVSAVLELSYHNLPSHIKPCFLCLAFFKEDVVFRAKRLMHMWVALGFVLVQEGSEESVEERARNYLDELINRNLVQVKNTTIDDRVKDCHVHDLIRELSIKKAKEEIGFESLIGEDEGSSLSSSLYKPRHRVVRGMENLLVKIDTSNHKKHLRSLFLNVVYREMDDPYFINPSYWKSFELLRILDIEGSILLRLPFEVRALIGIRYLRLRDNKYRLTLPNWLDDLKNLQVLDIADCSRVTFPDVTWKMDSLNHFYMNRFHSQFSNSMQKSSWHNLETLKMIRSDGVMFLLQRSGRRLRKLGIEMVNWGAGVAEIGRLLEEKALQVLQLRWTGSRGVVELPNPNYLGHLTKLKLVGGTSRCPGADKFPLNITHMTLSFSRMTTDPMPELGKLPNLLVLKLDRALSNDTETVKVSHEGFPRLKLLHLKYMRFLYNIEIEEGGMAELQRLQIYNCPCLDNNDSLRERIRPAEIIIVNDA